jgi:hypothetical protein
MVQQVSPEHQQIVVVQNTLLTFSGLVSLEQPLQALLIFP